MATVGTEQIPPPLPIRKRRRLWTAFFRYPQSDDDDRNRKSPMDDGQAQLNPSANISVCTKLS
jgi:hypothetical protein